jgi:hypothetical protein
MAPNIAQPSETSPLLPKADDHAHSSDAANGIASASAHAVNESAQDGGDIERQTSNGDTSKHQGLPEVRKRLKYIFPAITIGVSTSHYCILRRVGMKSN